MRCDAEDLAHYMQASYSHASMHIFITISAVAVFIGTRHVFSKIRNEMAHLTVIIIDAGPIGLTSELIAVQCKGVHRLIIIEEENRSRFRSLEVTEFTLIIWKAYDKMVVSTHVLASILNTSYKFYHCTELKQISDLEQSRDCNDTIDAISGRKVVICCDGRSGLAGQMLGLSDECVYHSTASFGAMAAIERSSQTLVPKSEIRVHNIGFDLSAYVSSEFEEDSNSKFTLKIFGNLRCRFLALAVRKSDSKIVNAMKTVLDKSVKMDINLGIKGLSSLEPFIDRITVAETEYNIMSSLIYTIEHSDKICREFVKHGLKEYLFL
ncbi:hypothetical protein MAR_025530 [Mya arenaria]|uniref:Uncharacterized protein n=1 Tax=Mya arenaria TaxID=6604 RepID=A0ABY7EQ26_MYAAR|nr:hypothetical protein MAR_025530 [Mya arenaria]